MALDLKNAQTLSLLVLGITFLIFLVILYTIKPKCIMRLNEEHQYEIDYLLLISYSLLFSCCCAIITLLCNSQEFIKRTKKEKSSTPKKQKYGKNDKTPEMAFNFSTKYKLF